MIDRAAFGLYTKRFLRTLVPKALAKDKQIRAFAQLVTDRNRQVMECLDPKAAKLRAMGQSSYGIRGPAS